ncbi:hypothetical protein [Streptomyces carminius]|uniref:hypothetical protein n=1 Tax=Streptomyces carminius TaxID=2665496 RepID=UPI0011B3950E|nr:hypothetical protein [Streptomyces carminius]
MATDTGQSVLLLALLPAGLLVGCALLVLALWKGRGERRNVWAARSALLLAGAVACHTLGLLHVVRLESAYHDCTYERYGVHDKYGVPEFTDSADRLFPVGSVCSWEDGVTIELVPRYVNPAVMVFLTGAFGCAVAAAARRGRHGRPVHTERVEDA